MWSFRAASLLAIVEAAAGSGQLYEYFTEYGLPCLSRTTLVPVQVFAGGTVS
jgi:hypothetical protein